MPLVLLLALAAPPDFESFFDPAKGEAGPRTKALEAALRGAGGRGIARAVAALGREGEALSRIARDTEQQYERYLEADRRWWAMREEAVRDYRRKHGRDPAEIRLPEGIDKEFLRIEDATKAACARAAEERLLHERSEALIVAAALEIEAEGRAPVIRALAVGASRNREPAHRLRCVRMLAALPGEDAAAALARAVDGESDPALKGLMLEAWTSAPLDALAKALSDDDWPVRAGAARALGRAPVPEAVDLLVARLAEEPSGRVVEDCEISLRRLTGRDGGWGDWWPGARDGWRPPADPPEDLAAGRDGPVEFAGIRTRSRDVIFCLDGSAGAWEAVARIAEQAVAALPDGVRFNLVIYDEKAHAWRRSLAEVGPSVRDDALKFVRGWEPRGKRDVATGLLAAFDLALPRRGKPPEADTVFLVAAAPPNTGPTFAKYFNVLDAVLAANATLGLRVHTCGPSPTNFGNYLVRIAAQFGGRHAG